MANSPPKVQLTKVFADELVALGVSPADFAKSFADWKDAWPKWEDNDYYFGKDGDYYDPKRGDKFVLRHVHMEPEDPAYWPEDAKPLEPDERAKIIAERAAWLKRWNERSAARYRTSCRVLVYVDGGRHGYLLIHLAVEPDGHDRVTANKALMEQWADVAERFRFNGEVLI